MAKIDVTTIDGFDSLTAEEKVAKLMDYEFEAPADSEEVMKLKTALSKSNSEAADWKRQYRDTLSEAERAKAEREEEDKKLHEELAMYRKKETVMNYKDKYRSKGYSDELATSSAQAMADGDMETVLNNMMAFIDEREKAINASALNQQPSLTPGNTPSAQSIEDKQIADLRKWAGLT